MKRLLPGLVVLLLPAIVQAVSFQTRLEHVQWTVEGDRFECLLIQPIADFGQGVFVRRAGEKPIFQVRANESWFARGTASLYAAAVPWQAMASDLQLGSVQVANNERTLESSQAQAGRLITGLLEGRAPVVRHRTVQGERLEVRVLPVDFTQAYRQYLECTAKLLPVNYNQIKQTSVRFETGGFELSEQTRAHLDILLEFMQEDKSINKILLDGHSDNTGERLVNRDVSRRRALAVKTYLVERGIDEKNFIVRFHGERYPVKPNTNAANRAANRRVTIRLERVDTSIAAKLEESGEEAEL